VAQVPEKIDSEIIMVVAKTTLGSYRRQKRLVKKS